MSNKQSSYHNTVYDSNNSQNKESNNTTAAVSNERKELQDINNRLGTYINAVRDLTQIKNFNTSNILSQNNQASIGPYSFASNPLYFSMKNLEKDLETFKQLYEEEIKLMRVEIEELSTIKNNYSLDNYNLELKLKDFIEKFEEIKTSNQMLISDLNEAKSKNNRLEYELESLKLDSDKPNRENKQLRKDLEDLLVKLNEKQAISDNEISYRQELEIKLKELNDAFTFERKLADKEIENYKSQLKLANDAIDQLETKLNESTNREIDSNEQTNKRLIELEFENNKLKIDNKQLEDQNESLKHLCSNLESVILNLESMKKSLEDKIGKENRNMISSTENTVAIKNLGLEIKSIKKKLENEENRLNLSSPKAQQFQQQQQQQQPYDFNSLSFNSSNNKMGNIILKQQQQQPQLNYENQSDLRKYDLEMCLGQYITPSNRSNDLQNLNLSIDGSSNKYSNLPIGQLANNNNNNLPLNRRISSTVNLIEQQQHHQQQQQQQSSRVSARSTPQQLDLVSLQQQQHQNQQQRRFSNLFNNEIPTAGVATPFNNINSTQQFNIRSASSSASNLLTKRDFDSAKDYTTDLFNNFERTTLFNLKRPDMNKSNSSNGTDNPITEASYTGNIKIHEVNKNGYFVRLINMSNTIEEDLSHYTIQQMVSGMPVAVYRLPTPVKLPPGHTLTVWARTDEVEQQPPHTFVWNEQDKWGTGPECTTILSKPNGQAVSWTTGCHKYGNIDYDEILPVYSLKRNKTPTAQLNRQKLIPQTIFSPTKHPHGSSSKSQTTDTSLPNESNKLNNSNSNQSVGQSNQINSFVSKSPDLSLQLNLFANQKPRPTNSAKASRKPFNTDGVQQRPQSSVNMNNSGQPYGASESHDEVENPNDLIYQENCSYFQKSQFPQPQVLVMNKIK